MKDFNCEEFIRHTNNMVELAKSEDDLKSAVFFESVLAYFDQYLQVFCKE